MKAIIAAGGSGTRLRPLTFSSNKHLLPVANKPLLLYPIEAIAEVGITQIGIIVNETRPALEALLGNGKKWGLEITYIPQEKPLGLAHVVKIAEDFLAGEAFVFHLGDNIFTAGIKRPYEHFVKTRPDALLTMVVHEENFRLGVPYFDAKGKLERVVEKPAKPPNHFAVPGLYFFNHHVFEAFGGKDAVKPSARGELEITDLYTYLLQHQYRVETEEVDGRWMDPGKFVDMLEANAFMLEQTLTAKNEGQIDEATKTSGVVKVGKRSRVNNCQLVGPVVIGDDCLIEESVIGPDVSIDNHCKLENVTVRNSIVMQDSTLFDIKEPITESMIGKNTEVWGTEHDGVSLFIGDNCKVRLS